MKKVILTLFVLGLVFCVVFVFWISTDTLQENIGLIEIIYQHVKSNNRIDFDVMITDFEWDEMFIFGKYSSPETLLRSRGVAMKKLDTPIRHSEVISLLVFVNNKEIVAYVNHPISKGYFRCTGVFQRDFSKFNVERGLVSSRVWFDIVHIHSIHI